MNGRARSDMVQTSDFRGRKVLSEMGMLPQLAAAYPSTQMVSARRFWLDAIHFPMVNSEQFSDV